MVGDFLRAVAILPEPRVRGVLWRGILISLATLIGLVAGIEALIAWAAATSYPWLDRAAELLGLLGALVLAWFLFPSVVVAASSLFLDRVVDVVELRHEPPLGPPRPVPLDEAIFGALRLLALSIALNLIALPLYFLPGLNVPLWVALNGWLIGREYFELVAQRRLSPPAAAGLRRAHYGRVWLGGIAIALVLTIPFVNLVAPIIGAAFMTYRFHRIAASPERLSRLRQG